MTLKIALIFETAEVRDALTDQLPSPPGGSISGHIGGARQLATVMQQDPPDVVILVLANPDDADFELIEAASMRMPGVLVLLVCPDTGMVMLKRAMRAGVRDVLPAPLSAQTVELALQYVREARALNARALDKHAALHAFIPAKGGSGCTFLATNLAYQLSATGRRVLLIDLNLYFGEAATYLCDRKPPASVVDVARQSQRLDAALLGASVLKTHEQLHVLAAPELPYQLESLTPETVADIVALARSEYDFVLLDLGRSMNPATVKALDLAEHIHLVMGQTLPALHDAKRMTQVFAGLGYAREKVQLLVNRHSRNSPVPLNEVANATGHRVSRTVPASDEAVLASINQGMPLQRLAPRDPVVRSLQQWVQALSPVTVTPGRHRWFPTFARGF